ncbi:hypothetical protein QTG54_016652 [Skeletonema marinoi]|uniref:PS II complex 12 kDa extrinsic protein n=1 Tax=Skeletonema marinoi TaxID=267567 RepID=A0AAD9D4I8_9STRA|nr:hypothetical protein QTG54_016652 [Skeletonema marinoi]
MKVVIPTIRTLLSISTLLSVCNSSVEAKGMIRRNARMEEASGDPEVADILNGTPTGKALPYQVGLSQAVPTGDAPPEGRFDLIIQFTYIPPSYFGSNPRNCRTL